MSRPADATRADLVEAAIEAFAAKGFEGASVREIARAAGANLAAISYHFGGKEGLYREVLKQSVTVFALPSLDPEAVAGLDRDEALRLFLREQVSAMRRPTEIARHLRIFAWEELARTDVFRDFLATEPLPFLEVGAAIVARYLPDAGAEERAVALLWLVQQAEPFIRNPERLAGPPLNVRVDSGFVERLTDTLWTLVSAGLEALAARYPSRAASAA